MSLHRGSWLLFLGLLLTAAPARPAEPPTPLLDLHGDPLPVGAVVRMGTVRWNHGAKLAALYVAGDGKTVGSLGEDRLLKFWDPATGKVSRQYLSPGFIQMFSPDGTLFAASNQDGGLRLHDAATGMELRAAPGSAIAFAPDGKTLVTSAYDRTTRNYSVNVIDTATGNVVRALSEQPVNVNSGAFSPDGNLLALGCGDGFIYLHEVATGKETGCCIGHRSYVQAVAFSPDGKTLASGSKDHSVRFWDVASSKELRRFDAPAANQLTFAADGKSLTVVSSESALCRVIDAESGKVKHSIVANPGVRTTAALSRDGSVLASLTSPTAFRLWDLKTSEEQGPAEAVQPMAALAFSPDGKTLASGGSDRRVYLWDTVSGKLLRRLHGHQAGILAVAFSADGKLLASGSAHEDMMVCIWDPASGQELRQLPGHMNGTQSLHFLPGGNTLVALTRRGIARRWDAGTGQELPLLGLAGFMPSFSADGRFYLQSVRAPNAATDLQLIESASGKVTCKIPLERDQRITRMALSPDGRWIVAASGNSPFNDQKREHLYEQWHAATGKKVRSFGKVEDDAGRTVAQNWMTFSPDGRLLADTDRAGRVRLWEMATGQERQALQGHASAVAAGVFSPDGRRFATAGGDGQMLIWDLFGLHASKPLALKPDELEAAWNDLGDSGPKGVAALGRLLRSAEQTLPLLREKVKPAAPIAADRVARLVADLDSNQFEVRDKATKELEAAGEPAAGPLRKVLVERKPSLEMRQRIEGILQQLEGFVVSPERLRVLRALEALEHLGTPEDHAVLKAVAGGVPESRITQEAKAALERLARRAPAMP